MAYNIDLARRFVADLTFDAFCVDERTSTPSCGAWKSFRKHLGDCQTS